jgi:hypothetical protein
MLTGVNAYVSLAANVVTFYHAMKMQAIGARYML